MKKTYLTPAAKVVLLKPQAFMAGSGATATLPIVEEPTTTVEARPLPDFSLDAFSH